MSDAHLGVRMVSMKKELTAFVKLVSASGRAAAVAARKTVVEAPARGAQLSPVRERCSTWRVAPPGFEEEYLQGIDS
jgi:hypothetical protein